MPRGTAAPVAPPLHQRHGAEAGGQRERLRVEHRQHVRQREAGERDAGAGRDLVAEQVARDGHHGEQAGQAGEIRQHQAATDGWDADLVETAQDQRHQREEAVLLGQRRRVQHTGHVEVAQPVPGDERVPEVLRRIAHRRVACRHPPRRPLGGGEVEDPRQGPRDEDRADHLTPGPGAATSRRRHDDRRRAARRRGSRCTSADPPTSPSSRPPSRRSASGPCTTAARRGTCRA